MLGVVCQQPVRLAGHSRKNYGDIRGVPDEVTARPHRCFRGVGNHLRIGKFDEPTVVFKQLVAFSTRQALRVKEQILFDFIANNLC
jgi:hypothetical protein